MSRWSSLVDRLDASTGWVSSLRRWLATPVYGGARWRYALGAVFVALVLVEVLTGAALMTVYAPSTQTAWASTWFLQEVTPWGAVVRGAHHFASHALVVVMGLYALRVLLDGEHRRPRAAMWWAAMAIGGLVLAMNVTGFPLAWDQRGYWASRVETGIIGSVPLVGAHLRALLLGGPRYGALSLSRFFTLHVVALPLLLALALRLRFVMLRQHGMGEGEGGESWWPSQAARDAALSLVAVAAVLFLARRFGAPLDAPADPQSQYHAEPEWYFAPLSQLLRELAGPAQLLGTVIVPGLIVAWVAALPYTDREGRGRAMRAVVYLPLVVVALTAGWLAMKLVASHADPNYVSAKADEARRAARARELARGGIPAEGALDMVRNDPRVRPRELFAQHCGTCHAVQGESRQRRGPRLDGFGSRQWAAAVVTWPDHPELFGATEIHEMPPQLRRLREEGVRAVSEWLYSQGVEPGDPPADAALAATGSEIYHRRCTVCHQGAGDTSETEASERDAPDLDGWGSRAWIRAQVVDPASPRNYGARNHMPSFRDRLSADDLARVVEYTRSLRRRPAPEVRPPPAPPPPPEESDAGTSGDGG